MKFYLIPAALQLLRLKTNQLYTDVVAFYLRQQM